MDELEDIRQRRLRELQARQQQAAAQDPAAAAEAQAAAAAQREAAVESLLQQVLDEDARARLTRIRMSRPELAEAVTTQLAALARSGRLARRLTDADLRALLAQLAPKDRDIRITRK